MWHEDLGDATVVAGSRSPVLQVMVAPLECGQRIEDLAPCHWAMCLQARYSFASQPIALPYYATD